MLISATAVCSVAAVMVPSTTAEAASSSTLVTGVMTMVMLAVSSMMFVAGRH